VAQLLAGRGGRRERRARQGSRGGRWWSAHGAARQADGSNQHQQPHRASKRHRHRKPCVIGVTAVNGGFSSGQPLAPPGRRRGLHRQGAASGEDPPTPPPLPPRLPQVASVPRLHNIQQLSRTRFLYTGVPTPVETAHISKYCNLERRGGLTRHMAPEHDVLHGMRTG